MTANSMAAEILETSVQGFARQATVKFHERLSDSGLELAENLPAWQGHFKQRIIELAAALRAEQPALFTEKVLWLRKAYAARGISSAIPKAVLEIVSETVADAMPGDAAAAVSAIIAEAVTALDSPEDGGFPDSALNPHDERDALTLRYIAACMDGQTLEAASMILDAIDNGLSPEDAVIRVLLPAEKEIGNLWHRNDASISQEHLLTNTTIELLAIIGRNFARAPGSGHKVLTASVSGNVHDIGIRATDLMFRLAGWRTFYLGTDLPPNEIAGSADYFDVDVVILSATIATQIDAVTRTVEAVRRTAADPLIIVGGSVFESALDLWKHVGADALSPRIDDVVSTTAQLLEKSPPGSAD